MRTEKKTEKLFCLRNQELRLAKAVIAGALALLIIPVPAAFSGNTALTVSAASGEESGQAENGGKSSKEKVTLRIANWEEYIDEGDWDEEERIDLENGASILGEHSMVDDFEEWYYETYGKRVRVFLLEFLRPEKKFGSL